MKRWMKSNTEPIFNFESYYMFSSKIIKKYWNLNQIQRIFLKKQLGLNEYLIKF